MIGALPAARSLAGAGLAALLTGCGTGVAAVAAGAGDSGGGTRPALSTFVVPDPKVSPAPLCLEANVGLAVELTYSVAGSDEEPMSLVSGNPAQLAPGTNDLQWDFASDLGTTRLTRDVTLRARQGGALVQGGELALFGMGNDPPVVVAVEPVLSAGEAAGNVEVELTLRDSSSDSVTLTVEWRRAGDPPEAWQPASVGGVPSSVGTDEDGETFSFFWRSESDGLGNADDEFLLRITADDGTLESGLPTGIGRLASAPFRLDNNAAPIVQLQNDAVISNPDERRGIPIPFRVIDEESDEVEVIFQWRRDGEEFPSLDLDGDGTTEDTELDALLAEPTLRRERHVCTPYSHYARGRVVPIDAGTVRLPELAGSEAWILAPGIVGRTLEILRPSSIPAPITLTWGSNPLASPIAALPLGDGLTAVVLDMPGNGRLREIELATGTVVREIAALGQGIPSAMCFERGGEKAVLVALDDAGTWRLERLELANGVVTELVVSNGIEPAPVRGIASLGTSALVFTAGSSVLHLDYGDLLAPRLGQLLTGLATPWGVVVDPLLPDRLYLSERGANRVFAVELNSHGKLPVVVRADALQLGTLEAPEALALERNGSRVLIATSAIGGGQELVGLDLGAQGRNVSFPVGTTTAAGISSLATGPDGLRLLCVAGTSELLVASGIEQRRTIAVSTSDFVSPDRDFDPPLRSNQPWRIASSPFPLRASPAGSTSRYVWDSADAGRGRVWLRAVARGDELGPVQTAAAPKNVRGELEVEALSLPTTSATRTVMTADLDGDGDRDIVSGTFFGAAVSVFWQDEPGGFKTPALLLGGAPTVVRPVGIAVADLDADGDLDLVSANYGSQNLTLFHQDSAGVFGTPVVLGGPGLTRGPVAVVAADLDGDGDVDLVSSNRDGSNLTIFRQEPGSFVGPIVVGGPGTTDLPVGLATGDLDGDGDLDLVSANSGSDNLTVFRQDSPGTFGPQPIVLGGAGETEGCEGVAVADIDGDGDMDLVSANPGGEGLAIFFHEGGGSFPHPPMILRGPDRGRGAVAAADLDGDGDQDLVTGFGLGAISGRLAIFRQAPVGVFTVEALDAEDPKAGSVTAADVDGDGRVDVVAGSGVNVGVFLQAGTTRSSPAALTLGQTGVTTGPTVISADLDGDGSLDLASANALGNDMTVFWQRTPGGFDVTPTVLDHPTALEPVSPVAADLDGDGDLDLGVANLGGDTLSVFWQESPGRFTDSPLAIGDRSTTHGPCSLTAADLDLDGELDLVSANKFGDNLAAFRQDGPGTFAAPMPVGGPSVTKRPAQVNAADLDGDGHLDLIVSNEGEPFTFEAGYISVFPLEGGFGTPPVLLDHDQFGPQGAPSVTAVDLDANGHLDLVAGGSATILFSTSPSGLFLSTILTPLSFRVLVTDHDDDGDLDLVGLDGEVFVQASPGRFTPAPQPFLRTGIPEFAGDLDGDGDNDLVTVEGDRLRLWWGAR